MSKNQLFCLLLNEHPLLKIFTPCTCARGKAIGFVSLLSVVCSRHENRQIATSRHLSDSYVRRICPNQRQTGFTMLQIDWQGPQVSQIGVFFIGHAYRLQAICYLLMRTSPKHYVGKDCQHTRILELAAHAGQCRIHVRCSVRAGYVF